MTDDVRKLLGGYATGTLSDSEKLALFAAALEDQELFEELSKEEALREVLDDPAARAQLLDASSTPKFSIRDVFAEWLDRPRSKAMVATAAVLVLAIAVSVLRQRPETYTAKVIQVPILQQPTPSASLPPNLPTSPPVDKKKQRTSSTQPPAKPPIEVAERRESKSSEAVQVTSEAQAIRIDPASPENSARQQPAAPPAAAIALRKAESIPTDPHAKILTAGDLTLRYKLLKRDPSGAFQPVLGDAELQPGDAIRLAVSANQRGVVAVAASPAGRTFTAPVEPGGEATLPTPGPLLVDSVTTSLHLTFANTLARPNAGPLADTAPQVNRLKMAGRRLRRLNKPVRLQFVLKLSCQSKNLERNIFFTALLRRKVRQEGS